MHLQRHLIALVAAILLLSLFHLFALHIIIVKVRLPAFQHAADTMVGPAIMDNFHRQGALSDEVNSDWQSACAGGRQKAKQVNQRQGESAEQSGATQRP